MERGLIQRIFDWIWYHWCLGGNYEKMDIHPDKELYSRMTGKQAMKYYKSCTRRKKKARELKEYYDFVNKQKQKKKE